MIHLKYNCKVNFMKLPLIWIYVCLKLVFENATAGRNTGCRSVVNCARYQPTPTFPAFHTSVESMTPPAVQTRFTRGRVQELKNGHNSVTVQNRTHVYMNFFHHKGLGNHLLQLCPKVVKHPVYYRLVMHGNSNIKFTILHFSYSSSIIFLSPLLYSSFSRLAQVFTQPPATKWVQDAPFTRNKTATVWSWTFISI